MTKRIDQAALAFAVRHIASRFVSRGASGSGSFQHAVHVVDSKHHLVGRPGDTLIVLELAHYHLGALAVDTELHAMGLADADVLDQPEHVDIPGGRFAHIGNAKHRDHPRPRG